MRIHWFSPLVPAHTAIADYTSRVAAALAQQADLILWTDEAYWYPSLDRLAHVRRFDPQAMPWEELHEGAVFYNIGNNSRFHQAIWQASRRCPGFCIMHDVLMHDSVAHDHRVRGDREGYIGIMRSLYGERGERDAELHWKGVVNLLQMGRLYSCAPYLLEASLGAIVHSEAARRALAREVDVPVIRMPLPFPARPRPARRQAADDGPPWRLVVFGFLGANRCLNQTLEALARVADPRFELHIYGDVEEPAALEAAIERLGLRGAVTVHGFVPDAELGRALDAAHLALNLRYPTKGEASYSQLRIWSHALPSLVTRIGWYAEQPAGTVSLVRPDFLVEDTAAHLRAYAAQPAAYRAVGERGYEHFAAHHSPRGYAARIVELAGRIGEYRAQWTARRMRARAAEAGCGWLPADILLESR